MGNERAAALTLYSVHLLIAGPNTPLSWIHSRNQFVHLWAFASVRFIRVAVDFECAEQIGREREKHKNRYPAN